MLYFDLELTRPLAIIQLQVARLPMLLLLGLGDGLFGIHDRLHYIWQTSHEIIPLLRALIRYETPRQVRRHLLLFLADGLVTGALEARSVEEVLLVRCEQKVPQIIQTAMVFAGA